MLPPIVDIKNFSKIFLNFKGKKIGFIASWGNVGDLLIEDSAVQLFKKFSIEYKFVNDSKNPDSLKVDECIWADEFVFNGGGNMGSLYKNNYKIRKEIIEKYHKPLTILPQSFNSPEDLEFKRVWLRETDSFRFKREAEIAPDLALAYEYPGEIPEATEDVGVWLRGDLEKVPIKITENLGDPVKVCKTPTEYILLASKYNKIVTNRLHFAIAGLIARRRVVLLPNSYNKNYSMWNTWLKYLGCEWNPFWTSHKIKERKIAIYGGTFNPPHNGHSLSINFILKNTDCDELWIMPSAERRDKVPGVSKEDRLEMIKLMVKDKLSGVDKPIIISGIEYNLPSPSSTFQTKQYLAKKYPDNTFVFVYGSDVINDIENKWYRGIEVAQSTNFIFLERKGVNTDTVLDKLPKATFLRTSGTIPEVSSSEIRDKIKRGESVADLMSISVIRYIESKRFYL